MTSILESVIGPERFAAHERGEAVTMTPEEATRFKVACDRARESQRCNTPCLFRSE